MTWSRRNAGPDWKPRRCAGCGKPQPSFNRDGGKAGTPWRCGSCDATAEAMPATEAFADAPAVQADDRQGALL